MHYLLSLVFYALVCCPSAPAVDVNLQTAQDINWSSINFKTILEWNPKPINYTYTVEIRDQFSAWKKKCIYTENTECDVTDVVQNVRNTYDVRITSEIDTEEVFNEEFPYADGPSFNPYEQTIIGKPSIESFSFNKDNTKLTVVVKDPLTPYRFNNNTFKSIRDIFQNDFQYTLYYRKASSTGKKKESSSTNEIVLNTEKGESYCFYVRGTVPSRKQNRDSQDSDEKCTSTGNGEFDLSIVVAVVVSVALIIIILILSVILCKCRKAKKEEKAKETMPLNDVSLP